MREKPGKNTKVKYNGHGRPWLTNYAYGVVEEHSNASSSVLVSWRRPDGSIGESTWVGYSAVEPISEFDSVVQSLVSKRDKLAEELTALDKAIEAVKGLNI